MEKNKCESVCLTILTFTTGYTCLLLFFLRLYQRLVRSLEVHRAKCCDVWRKWLELTRGRGRNDCPGVTVKVKSVPFNGGRGVTRVMTLLLKSAERTRRRVRHSYIWRNSRRRPQRAPRGPSSIAAPFSFPVSLFCSWQIDMKTQ